MGESRLPKPVFYGKLKDGTRRIGAPKLREERLKKWREVVAGSADVVRRRNVELWTAKRAHRHEAAQQQYRLTMLLTGSSSFFLRKPKSLQTKML